MIVPPVLLKKLAIMSIRRSYLWLFVGVGISNGRHKKRSRALHLQRSFCYLTSEMSNVYEHPIN